MFSRLKQFVIDHGHLPWLPASAARIARLNAIHPIQLESMVSPARGGRQSRRKRTKKPDRAGNDPSSLTLPALSARIPTTLELKAHPQGRAGDPSGRDPLPAVRLSFPILAGRSRDWWRTPDGYFGRHVRRSPKIVPEEDIPAEILDEFIAARNEIRAGGPNISRGPRSRARERALSIKPLL